MSSNTFPVTTLDGESIQVSYLKHVNQRPIFVDQDGNEYTDSDDQIGKVELVKYSDGTKPPEDRESDSQEVLKDSEVGKE